MGQDESRAPDNATSTRSSPTAGAHYVGAYSAGNQHLHQPHPFTAIASSTCSASSPSSSRYPPSSSLASDSQLAQWSGPGPGPGAAACDGMGRPRRHARSLLASAPERPSHVPALFCSISLWRTLAAGTPGPGRAGGALDLFLGKCHAMPPPGPLDLLHSISRKFEYTAQ